MLFLPKKIKLNNITFNFFKRILIKAVSAAAVLNIKYFIFNVFFIILFYNFKAYDIKLFVIKIYSVINLKVNKLLIKLEFIVLYNPKLLY